MAAAAGSVIAYEAFKETFAKYTLVWAGVGLVYMFVLVIVRDTSSMHLLCFMANTGLVVVSLIGWLACQTKKDDLNLHRANKNLSKVSGRLKTAGGKLSAALTSIKAALVDMDKIGQDITEKLNYTLTLLDKAEANLKQRQRSRVRAALEEGWHTLPDVAHYLSRLFVYRRSS